MNLLSTLNRRTALATGAATVFAIGSLSNALAMPPDKVNFGPFQVFGNHTASCQTFDVLADFTFEGFFVVHYDQDDNITHVNQHISYTDATYYNSEFPDIKIEGGPGEIENNRFVYTGDSPFLVITGPAYKITLPGAGVIFLQGGRVIFDLNTFEVLVQAGPSDWLDGNADALCAALTP